MDFKNKVCWITGASTGIGAALAVELSGKGAILILSLRKVDKLEEVRARCNRPEHTFILPCDMEQTSKLPEVAEQAWRRAGHIDYVFLNAGLALRDWLVNTDFELMEKIMRVNFFSSAAIAKCLLPKMKVQGSGCFVVTSSLSGKYGIPKLSAYSASKHALHGYFETLRAEHARDRIRVTMIVPGLVKTNITVHGLTGNGAPSGRMQEAIAGGIAPEICARKMISAVLSRKNEAVIGGIETYSVYFKRFFPGWFDAVIRNNPMRRIRMLTKRSAV